MSTTSAIPMINNIPMINTGMIDQNLQNTDLVQQIIAQNQQRFNTADTAPFFFPQGQTMGIPQAAPLQNLGMDTSYGVANEPDDTQSQEYMDQVQKSKGDGIGGLLKFLVGLAVPGAGFLMNLPGRGLEGIRSLNQRIQGSDFGRSKTLQEYLQKREARKDSERLQTVGQQLKQSSDRGGGYQPTSREQNVARTESRVSNGRTRAYGL
jgi:hypothetical protein